MPDNTREPALWLAYAIEDLEYGRFGASKFPRSAAWNFQQAAEKALKAVLFAQNASSPRTHDLAYLLQLVIEAESSAGFLVNEVMELSELSTGSRYPADLPDINLDDCRRYENASAAIVAWVVSQIVH
jgi:HEPN domain-containing protein